MKTCMIVLAALAMVAGSRANAGAPGPTHYSYFTAPNDQNMRNLALVLKGYTFALEANNDGVVQSALAQVAYLGVSLPGSRFDAIKKAVEELAVSGKTPIVRYKAYLASIALDSPVLFARERGAVFIYVDVFFG